MSDILRFVIQSDPPSRLDKALARDVPEGAGLSRSRLVRALEQGEVTVNGGPPGKSVAEGDVVEVRLAPRAAEHLEPEDIPLDILHEDAEVIVVNKPAGLVVHPAPGTPSGTLVNALMAHCGDSLRAVGGAGRPGIVHRIDKDTSGLLVVAKTDRAHQALAAQFADHSVGRRYLAVCHGVPAVGDPRLRGLRGVAVEPGDVIRVTTELARHKHDRQRQAVVWSGGRHAVTRFRVDRAFAGAAALLACELETGRTHQIRVHAAYIGHGLIGDPVYGGRRKVSAKAAGDAAASAAAGFPRQALHAATLAFDHPATGERMHFEAPLPDDMRRLVAAFEGQAES